MRPRSFTSEDSELRAHPVGLQRHHDHIGEDLLEGGDRQADERGHDQEEGHAVGVAPSREMNPLAGPTLLVCVRHRYPAILTVVEAPQTAREKKKSTMLMATMEVRTALPTATPTPAGPPEAV